MSGGVVHAQPPGRAHLLYVLALFSSRREGGVEEAREIAIDAALRARASRSRVTISILIACIFAYDSNANEFETFVSRSSFEIVGLPEGGAEAIFRVSRDTRRYPRNCSDCVGGEVGRHHSETHHYPWNATHEKGMDNFEIFPLRKSLRGTLSISLASRLCLVMYVLFSR